MIALEKVIYKHVFRLMSITSPHPFSHVIVIQVLGICLTFTTGCSIHMITVCDLHSQFPKYYWESWICLKPYDLLNDSKKRAIKLGWSCADSLIIIKDIHAMQHVCSHLHLQSIYFFPNSFFLSLNVRIKNGHSFLWDKLFYRTRALIQNTHFHALSTDVLIERGFQQFLSNDLAL